MNQRNLIVVRDHGEIAEIVLNRPAKLNAMNLDWVRELDAAVAELAKQPDLAAVVIRGEGRAFCSGLDLDMMAEGGMPPEFFPTQEKAFLALERLPAIVVAQIHGYCLGGGLQLALACDIRVASEDAVLGLPAARDGLPPGMAPWRLPQFVGIGRALRLCLAGESLSAAESLQLGLVDHVLPSAGFGEATWELVKRYTEVPHRAAVGIKEVVRSAFHTDFDTAFQRTRQIIAECHDEGVVVAGKWRASRATGSAPEGGPAAG